MYAIDWGDEIWNFRLSDQIGITILQSSSRTTAPRFRKMINLVLLVFTAILLQWNQLAIFLSSVFTKVQISFRFFPLDKQVVSSAKRTENNLVAAQKSLM